MSKGRLPYFGFVSRTGIFALIAALVFIFVTPGKSFAEIPGDQDISENVWASALAPVVDYGIYSERFLTVRVKPTHRGMSPMQTPPPFEEESEQESFDPKPHKPPERPGIPVDPSFLDQPLACTASVINASVTSGNTPKASKRSLPA